MVFLKRTSFKSGFTLVEVLISMMVMAISLTMMMNLFSGGLRSKKRAKDYNQAIDFAHNKILETILIQEFEPGVQEGRFDDDYSWRIEIISEDDAEDAESTIKLPHALKIYTIHLEVKWNNGRREKTYSISTIQTQEKRELSRVHTS